MLVPHTVCVTSNPLISCEGAVVPVCKVYSIMLILKCANCQAVETAPCTLLPQMTCMALLTLLVRVGMAISSAYLCLTDAS